MHQWCGVILSLNRFILFLFFFKRGMIKISNETSQISVKTKKVESLQKLRLSINLDLTMHTTSSNKKYVSFYHKYNKINYLLQHILHGNVPFFINQNLTS